jgi:hypothetical protein
MKIAMKREGETTEANEGKVTKGDFSQGRLKELSREPKGTLPSFALSRQPFSMVCPTGTQTN